MELQQTILVIDDNDDLRTTTIDQLISAGFLVRDAKDTETALRLMAADPNVDLVLADFRLNEKKTGVELAFEIREVRPTLPVVIVTAYPSEAAAAGKGHFPILAKPVPRSVLLEFVRLELTKP